MTPTPAMIAKALKSAPSPCYWMGWYEEAQGAKVEIAYLFQLLVFDDSLYVNIPALKYVDTCDRLEKGTSDYSRFFDGYSEAIRSAASRVVGRELPHSDGAFTTTAYRYEKETIKQHASDIVAARSAIAGV